jgi:hypothetical protein
VKKFAAAVVFFVLCGKISAFDHICSASIKASSDAPAVYEFFSVNLGSPVDILSLGIFIGGGTDSEGNRYTTIVYF